METKKYSSYAEIERDLEILKLEKEINYKKLLLSIETTKESIFPSNTVSKFYNLYKNLFSGIYGTILKIGVPYLLEWLINRKRGD
ncbi:MAG: DUF6327 family protein [Bacteroidota bacterium]